MHIMQDHHSYIHQSLNRETLPYFLTNRSLLQPPFPFRHQTEHNPTPHPTSFFLQTRLKPRTHHSCQPRLFLSNQYTEYAYHSNTQWGNVQQIMLQWSPWIFFRLDSSRTDHSCQTSQKKLFLYSVCRMHYSNTPWGNVQQIKLQKGPWIFFRQDWAHSSQLSNQVKMSCSSNQYAECTIQTLHEGKYWTSILSICYVYTYITNIGVYRKQWFNTNSCWHIQWSSRVQFRQDDVGNDFGQKPSLWTM